MTATWPVLFMVIGMVFVAIAGAPYSPPAGDGKSGKWVTGLQGWLGTVGWCCLFIGMFFLVASLANEKPAKILPG